MAWSTIVEPDVLLVGAVALLGVAVGSTFWGPHSHLLLTSSRPAHSVAMFFALVMGIVTLAFLPGVLLAMWLTVSDGGAACASAAAPHLWASIAFGLAVGMAAARWLNPALAAIATLATVGIVYALVPALTGKKLLNVGVTPLPMMDQRRSWLFAIWMGLALLALALALVHSIAPLRRRKTLMATVAVAVAVLLALPVPATFAEYRLERRVCQGLTTGHELCVPQSYAWLEPPAVDIADRMLTAAAAKGVNPALLPSRFEFGQFGELSSSDVSQMTLTTEFATSGQLPPLEVAGLLVTPSWCPQMRASEPPESLLRQAGVVAVWLAVEGGYIARQEAPNLVAQDVPDPSTLTAEQVNDAFTAARGCQAASWVP